MCRKRLYFKGMHKIVKEWEEESFDKHNQDAFAEAIDYILNDDEEDEDDYEPEEPYESQEEEEEEEDTDLESEYNFFFPDEEESESGSGYWTYHDTRIQDLIDIEKRFKILFNSGIDIEPELLVNEYYEICNTYERAWYEDFCVNDKTIFVSKKKGAQNGLKRCSARVQGKRDQALDFVIVLVTV
jgi:hypothetical protein